MNKALPGDVYQEPAKLRPGEFKIISEMIERIAGIHLSEAKQMLVVGRLSKRLRHYKMESFRQYFDFIADPKNHLELTMAIDLLTTNETSFFREPKHFELLKTLAEKHSRGRPFRVWSAASSTGQEAHTMAMVLADTLGQSPWEIFATDISERVLAYAREGLYPIEQSSAIPQALLKQYGLKGRNDQQGVFTFERWLRERITFSKLNLTNKLPNVGVFDVIFLRNVLIYFQVEIKKKVVENVVTALRPEGTFLIGHSESLHGVTDCVKMVKPTVYIKPGEKRY